MSHYFQYTLWDGMSKFSRASWPALHIKLSGLIEIEDELKAAGRAGTKSTRKRAFTRLYSVWWCSRLAYRGLPPFAWGKWLRSKDRGLVSRILVEGHCKAEVVIGKRLRICRHISREPTYTLTYSKPKRASISSLTSSTPLFTRIFSRNPNVHAVLEDI